MASSGSESEPGSGEIAEIAVCATSAGSGTGEAGDEVGSAAAETRSTASSARASGTRAVPTAADDDSAAAALLNGNLATVPAVARRAATATRPATAAARRAAASRATARPTPTWSATRRARSALANRFPPVPSDESFVAFASSLPSGRGSFSLLRRRANAAAAATATAAMSAAAAVAPDAPRRRTGARFAKRTSGADAFFSGSAASGDGAASCSGVASAGSASEGEPFAAGSAERPVPTADSTDSTESTDSTDSTCSGSASGVAASPSPLILLCDPTTDMMCSSTPARISRNTFPAPLSPTRDPEVSSAVTAAYAMTAATKRAASGSVCEGRAPSATGGASARAAEAGDSGDAVAGDAVAGDATSAPPATPDEGVASTTASSRSSREAHSSSSLMAEANPALGSRAARSARRFTRRSDPSGIPGLRGQAIGESDTSHARLGAPEDIGSDEARDERRERRARVMRARCEVRRGGTARRRFRRFPTAAGENKQPKK